MFLTSRTRNTLRRQSRFASLHAISSGALQALADGIMQPVLVLAAIAFLLGGSNNQIAAFAVIAVATWAFAPLLLQIIGSFVGRSYPIVFSAGFIRLIAVTVIGVIGFRIDDMSTDRIVGTLVAGYLAYQVASSIATQASAGLIVGSVPQSRQRSVLQRRAFAAVLAAFVAALVAWSVLRSDETFQRSVGLLLILAALSAFSATWFLLNIPGGAAPTSNQRPGALFGLALSAFRSVPFRRFIGFKILLALAAAVDPFLMVFGFRKLGIGIEYIGLSLVAYAAGHVVGHLVWPRWIVNRSPRVPFQIATFCRLLLLIWVVSLPTIATSTAYTDRFADSTVAMRAFAIGFVFLGLAGSVGNAANQRYLLDILPRGATQGAIMAANLVTAVFAFAPLGVAWLLQEQELDRILWVAIGCASLALLASGLLVESRVRIRTSAGSWRSRRRASRAV